MLRELEESAKNSLHAVVKERVPDDIQTRTVVNVGTPAMEIVQIASEENADLIVIATHGQSGWKKFISGSVTERVVRTAERPVLTIHAPKVSES